MPCTSKILSNHKVEGSPQTEMRSSNPVLQAANDVLRRQIRAAVSQEQKIKALQEQLSHMEHSAETGSVELLTLRRALAQRDAQVSAQLWIWQTLLLYAWLCCIEALLVNSLKATEQYTAASVALSSTTRPPLVMSPFAVQITELNLSQHHGPAQEQEIIDLRGQLAALQLENEDLKKELNAFEPAFFEEIEDLKFQHLQLQKHCAALESQLSGT